MAVAYLLGLLCVLGYVQGGAFYSEPAIIEDLRSADPSWPASRIVSGWPAEEGQFPYQISLRMVSGAGAVSSCGGSIIHHKWVITAAHCLANRISFVVRFGLTNLTRPEAIVETTHKYIYPGYNEAAAGVQTDDIALVGLNNHIEYTRTIQPARLQSRAQKNDEYDGLPVIVSGFGRTSDFGAASEILNWVWQRGVSLERCRSFYPNSQVLQVQNVCAQYFNVTTQSSCQGDSGGPLTLLEKDGRTTMIGIVSFGPSGGCSRPLPTGYVRPGHYHDWYEEVTGLSFDWDSEGDSKEESDSKEDSDSKSDSDSNSDEGGDEIDQVMVAY